MVAASAAAITLGADPEKIKSGFLKYKGVERRFDIRYQSDKVVYIDDYAHHPEELNATITSLKELYVGRKILGIFQPHLFSRTRDFAEGFARSLDQLDEAVLLDIYPARELPIQGITGDTIFKLMKLNKKHRAVLYDFPEILKGLSFDVLITLGAGNIDTIVPKITNWLKTEKR
jgi:UDP-N-acetylmuramate--alanine ligase